MKVNNSLLYISIFIICILIYTCIGKTCNIKQVRDFNACSFMNIGKYKMRGQMNPTQKHPRGLLFTGTSEIKPSPTGIQWVENYIAQSSDGYSESGYSTRDIKINPNGYISYTRDAYVSNKYVSSREGYATESTIQHVKFDIQGNFHWSGNQHSEMELIIRRIHNGFQTYLYIDNKLIRTKVYELIS